MAVGPASLVANSNVGGLTVKQLARLQAIRRPAPESLVPPAEHGRFEPRPLIGDSHGALDSRIAETFRYSAVTPAALRGALTGVLGSEGFTTVPDAVGPAVRKLPKETGFEISGALLAERNLRGDPTQTHRRDRSRYVGGVGGALATGVLVYVSLTHLNSPLGLLIIPSGLAFAVLLISVVSFENASYWSDVVVARYEGRVPPPPGGTPPTNIPTEYEVQIWVVRALTHDWGIRGASGRNVVGGLRDDELDPVRTALRRAITGKEGAEIEAGSPASKAEIATVGWKPHDALGQ